jgi:anthranilate/para-aminobenzoate synthase component I
MIHGSRFEITHLSVPAADRSAAPFQDRPWTLSPEDLALRLAHLPGFLWLDSAEAGAGAISLLTASPLKILTGSLLSDWQQIEDHLQHHALPHHPDWPFPAGGLFGWVGYDGDFTLGHYPHALLYFHDTRTWFEVGGLSSIIDFDQPSSPTSLPPATLHFTPQTTRADFIKSIVAAKAYIASGDIYQVNLTYPWQASWPELADPLASYLRLRQVSPAPHAAYLDLAGTQVLSASPELFLRLSGSRIVTRPIKGTRPRYPQDRERDDNARADLLASAKERAELLMITDLQRNDLGQVCEFGSVHVPELWKVEAYPQVFHLVATVEGRLPSSTSHAQAFRACFPGGSITGAPKKRATEIIAELEPHPRGLYTGAIGGFGFNGESLWSIAIRTAVRQNDTIHFHTGAGIVADSDPDLEYQETQHKAAGLLLMGQP